MSVGKFLAGTTLATPAIGGVSYVTYEELTKDTSTKEVSTSDSETTPTVTEAASAEQTGSDGGNVVAPQSSDSVSGGGVEQGHSEDDDAGSDELQKNQDSGTGRNQADQPPSLSPGT